MPKAHPDSNDSWHMSDGPASRTLNDLNTVNLESGDCIQQVLSRAGQGVCKSDNNDKQATAGKRTDLA